MTPTGTPNVAQGQAVAAAVTASDPDGDDLSYTWTATNGSLSGSGASVTWTAPSQAGTFTITVVVTDGHGGLASSSIAVAVAGSPNHAPAISSMTPANGSDYSPGQSTTCTVTASDADLDPLTYQWTATGGSFTGSGSSVTWTADQDAGRYTITCEVTDGRGGVALASRTVTVSDMNLIIW
jgi:hypothetical protein